jgi:WD40 repeat protein/serine/threonine protein kinase
MSPEPNQGPDVPPDPTPDQEETEHVAISVLDEYWEAVHRGEVKNLEEWLVRHPEIGSDVREDLRLIEKLHQAGQVTKRRPPLPLPCNLGPYQLLEVIGHGGMGEVFKARRIDCNKTIALKRIPKERQGRLKDLARFRREAEASTRLDHPNIVRVYEVGEHDGQPYLALEYVAGGTLAERLADAPLPPEVASELVESLARAIEYAHREGIVHRDLKPSNVLLQELATDEYGCAQIIDKEETDDAGGSASISVHPRPTVAKLFPKITDFGLAKLLDPDQEAAQTRTGDVVGTPAYMAPEQAIGQVRDVGTAADIYALGALLYEALTGRPPFKGATLLDTLEQVRTQEPVVPSRLQPKVPRDLDTICLKCLEKAPRQRYGRAGSLADDLRRFLEGAPIQARPAPGWKRAGKWARRRPAAAVLVAFGLLTLTALLVGLWLHSATLSVQVLRADQKAAEAKENADRAREAKELSDGRLYDSDLRLVQQAWDEAQIRRVEELLDRQRPEHTGGIDLRGFEWHYWNRLSHLPAVRTFTGHTAGALCAALSPDGKRLASCSRDRSVRVWDLASGGLLFLFQGHSDTINHVAFSPDGRWLASASRDRTVKIWSLVTGKEEHTLRDHRGWVNWIEFSPDGTRLASASHDGTINLWEWPNGRLLRTLRLDNRAATCVAFSRDRQRLASSWVGGLSIWNLMMDKEERHWEAHRGWITGLAFSADSQRLASASWDGTAKVWEVPRSERPLTFRGREGSVNGVAFSPSGAYLALAADDRTVRIYSVDESMADFTLTGHTDAVTSVAYTADGKQLASASLDGTVKVWNAVSGLEPQTLKGHSGWINGLAFSADGRCLASACGVIQDGTAAAGEVKVWGVASGRELHHFAHGPKEAALSVAFDPQGKRLASAGGGGFTFPLLSPRGEVKVWDTNTGQRAFTLTSHRMPVTCVTYSPDGSRLASCSLDQTLRVWDAATAEELHCLKGHSGWVMGVAYSPDGTRLASVGGKVETYKNPQGGFQYHLLSGEIKVWDASTGQQVLSFTGPKQFVFRLAFSPDGRWLATVGGGYEDGEQSRHLGEVAIWDATTGQEKLSLQGHTDWVLAVAFSPDNRRLATGSADETVRLWDLTTGQEVLTLRRHSASVHGGSVHALAFSPDGHRLAAAGQDLAIRIWDGTPMEDAPTPHAGGAAQ